MKRAGSIKARRKKTSSSVQAKYDEVRRLIQIGKERGYLLYDEVNALLPPEAEVDDLFASSKLEAKPPGVMLQALIIPERATSEGQLIASVALPWSRIVNMVLADPASAAHIDWRQWEEIVAGAYKQQGFEVILTPRSNDKGRDIIAFSRGIGCVRFFDQVKAYKPGHLVTAAEVREMVGVLALDPNVSKGIVTTTADFAPGIESDESIRRFMPYRLELKLHAANHFTTLKELRMRPVCHLIACIALMIATVATSGLAQTRKTPVLSLAESRRSAPEFALANSAGAPVTLSDFQGNVLLLDVWATWCTGCKEEMPWFIQFQKKYAKKGRRTVGVAMDDEGWNTVTVYLQTHAINYPIVIPDAEFSRSYNVTAMPVTLLIDRHGRVADWHIGIVPKGTWEKEIQRLLQEK